MQKNQSQKWTLEGDHIQTEALERIEERRIAIEKRDTTEQKKWPHNTLNTKQEV